MVHDSEFGRGRYDQNNYQKLVFYTSWLDESAELATNRSTGCKKILKFGRMFLKE